MRYMRRAGILLTFLGASILIGVVLGFSSGYQRMVVQLSPRGEVYALLYLSGAEQRVRLSLPEGFDGELLVLTVPDRSVVAEYPLYGSTVLKFKPASRGWYVLTLRSYVDDEISFELEVASANQIDRSALRDSAAVTLVGVGLLAIDRLSGALRGRSPWGEDLPARGGVAQRRVERA